MVEVILEAENCNHWSIDLYQNGYWECKICNVKATLIPYTNKPKEKFNIKNAFVYGIKSFIGLKN